MNNANTPPQSSQPTVIAVGDIVLVAYPFSDGTGDKRRPALVLSTVDAYGDTLLMGITSKQSAKNTVALNNTDLSLGQLPLTSWLKTGSVTAVHQSRIFKVLAKVKPVVLSAARTQICPRLGCK